ncbi:Crp/Fnr family transcriptional regulator [Glaciecola sp. SC05]|uniref:Crp/Fnr family transcriptional regulator n=1 Tax=Glaciecola sp. SC05 TaxID=1987355 RepID=UPI00352767F4
MNHAVIERKQENKQQIHTALTSLNRHVQCEPTVNFCSHKIFQKKDALYRAGDRFDGIYMLRSGSAKSVIHSSDGEQYVGNFLLPGDLIGLDGFSQHSYKCSVVFLETSSVVFYKEADIYKLLQNSDVFRTDLLQQMSTALVLEEERQLARREFSSKQRVAAFLLNYAQRLKSCDLSHEAFTLTMSRTDIANHTGMVIETVSRVFRQLEQENLIAFKHRYLRIVNKAGLQELL